VLWISHAGVARCVQWLLQHPAGPLPQAHEWPREAPAFGRWVCVPLPPT
jgi:alpha-ribazole phosphatase